MPRYLVERELPGAARLSAGDLQEMARRSNQVLADMNGRAHWLESYVTDDAVTCVYVADSPEAVREHAARGGFPVSSIRHISQVLDPATAG